MRERTGSGNTSGGKSVRSGNSLELKVIELLESILKGFDLEQPRPQNWDELIISEKNPNVELLVTAKYAYGIFSENSPRMFGRSGRTHKVLIDSCGLKKLN